MEKRDCAPTERARSSQAPLVGHAPCGDQCALTPHRARTRVDPKYEQSYEYPSLLILFDSATLYHAQIT